MKLHQSCRLVLALALALGTAACKPEFKPKSYAQPEQLFAASMKEYAARRWDNAVIGFEQLTGQLQPRDPLLPLSYFYLGSAQKRKGDNLLAAQSFTRLAEGFPDDSLADDALLQAGDAYSKMWRRPQLDPTYGESAITTLQSLASLYPDSPLVPRANSLLANLDNRFAIKGFDTGYLYLRRGAYDSAIIYFKDVIRLHPNAPKTREAYLRLLESYRAINYKADASDLCDAMRKNYPGDREIIRTCGSASSAAASTPRT